jgi:hypothetical protein
MKYLAPAMLLASVANLVALFAWPHAQVWGWTALGLLFGSCLGTAYSLAGLVRARRATDASLAELRAALEREPPEVREALPAPASTPHWARETVAEHAHPDYWAMLWGWSSADVRAAKEASNAR